MSQGKIESPPAVISGIVTTQTAQPPSPSAMRRAGMALGRGVRGRCPRCGEGALFRRRIEFNARCTSCGLQYQRNFGDTWMFMIITDRIPILFGIAVVYFGWRSTTWVDTLVLFLAMAIPLILTLRQRQGLALSLDYLSRVYLPDPSDEIHNGREYISAGAAPVT